VRRRQVVAEYPEDTNQGISTRLGALWRALPQDQKRRYEDKAMKIDAEHKLQYPDYIYS
jgi:hypothetical protein